MKKVLLLALALVLPTASLAENIKPGAIEVKGGSTLGFQSTTLKDDATGDKFTTSTFALDTSAAYYLNHNVGVGLELSYDNTTFKQTGLPNVTSKAWTLGPKVVFDQGLSPEVSFFGEAMVGLTAMDDDGFKTDGWGFGIGAGLKYFFVPAFSADLGVKYQYAKLKDDASNKATGSDLVVGIGFSVYLNNK